MIIRSKPNNDVYSERTSRRTYLKPHELNLSQDFQISMREGGTLDNQTYLSMNFKDKMLKPYQFFRFLSSKIQYFDDEGGDDKLCSACDMSQILKKLDTNEFPLHHKL